MIKNKVTTISLKDRTGLWNVDYQHATLVSVESPQTVLKFAKVFDLLIFLSKSLKSVQGIPTYEQLTTSNLESGCVEASLSPR